MSDQSNYNKHCYSQALLQREIIIESIYSTEKQNEKCSMPHNYNQIIKKASWFLPLVNTVYFLSWAVMSHQQIR